MINRARRTQIFVAAVCSVCMAQVVSSEEGPAQLGWQRLSLREKIGQTVMLKTDLERFTELGNGSLEEFFKTYPVGGIFMAHWEYDNPRTDTAVAALITQQIASYQAASPIPLVFAEDFETGVGGSLAGFTQLPRLMALGACNDPQLAYDYGKAVALQAKSLGIHWLFHPVADLNLNPQSPIANTRAMTDDPGLAVRLLSQQIKGMQKVGVAATIKHFPGDGTSAFDQHLTTTANALSLDEWRRTFGLVYQELINAGVSSVMIGHICLPTYQQQSHRGQLLPGTLSSELMLGLLKGELGFSGLVLSDALEMAGFAGYYDSQVEAEIASFLAGTDMLLWPSLEYIDELERRIEHGLIPQERLDNAVARVWELKRRWGVLQPTAPPSALSAEERLFIEGTAQRVAEKGITLVNGDPLVLSRKPEQGQQLLLVVVAAEDRTKEYETTRNLLQAHGYTVDLVENLSMEYWGDGLAKLERYAKVILCLDYHPHQPIGDVYPRGAEAMTIWIANRLPRGKLVVVSFGNPYLVPGYFKKAATGINAYSNDVSTQHAVVRALVGDIPFAGISPVKLDRQ